MLRDFGVRQLLLAFLGVSGFAILAAAAAMHSFLKVGEALDGITRDRVPSAVALLQLAAQAERIVAASPALVAVRSRAEHDAVSARIEGEARRLSGLVRELETGLNPGCGARPARRSGRRAEAQPRDARRACLDPAGAVRAESRLATEAGRHQRRSAAPAGACDEAAGCEAGAAGAEDRCRRPEPAVGH